MNADFPIDFVIPWVDGSDPEWIKVFNNYGQKKSKLMQEIYVTGILGF
ncbi:MAG: Stealth CR1 domain-containing protein [Spirochaetales bacterium]|nr:Stealth CR1 domain-containing protein [Spirochaetia bacterium]MDD7459750.1 Stealth CR1 domain-containing protein [Spirochaetales bacterium]